MKTNFSGNVSDFLEDFEEMDEGQSFEKNVRSKPRTNILYTKMDRKREKQSKHIARPEYD